MAYQSKEYSNRILKDKAYVEMVHFVKEIDSSANRETVTKKKKKKTNPCPPDQFSKGTEKG